jgi:hypothetical protein
MSGPSTPGTILPGGIVLIDEPAGVGVSTFERTGDVMLTIETRPGGNCGQVMIGLTANQALQLIDRLQANAFACRLAVAEGRGGVRFPDPPAGPGTPDQGGR